MGYFFIVVLWFEINSYLGKQLGYTEMTDWYSTAASDIIKHGNKYYTLNDE